MFEREGYLLVLLYFVEEDMMDYLFESMSPILVLTELVVTPIRNFFTPFQSLILCCEHRCDAIRPRCLWLGSIWWCQRYNHFGYKAIHLALVSGLLNLR